MNKRTMLIVGIILAVCCVAGGVVLAIASFGVSQSNETYGELSEACFGNAVPDAAAYAATSGSHPAIGMKLYGTSYSTYNYPIPENALAASVSETQVVFCMGDQDKALLERCPYIVDNSDQPTHIVERYQYELAIKLVEAKTGILIAEETLVGKAPRECLDEETFLEGSETVAVDGDKVSDADIQAWLRQYIIIP
jgi:hypothetical protein